MYTYMHIIKGTDICMIYARSWRPLTQHACTVAWFSYTHVFLYDYHKGMYRHMISAHTNYIRMYSCMTIIQACTDTRYLHTPINVMVIFACIFVWLSYRHVPIHNICTHQLMLWSYSHVFWMTIIQTSTDTWYLHAPIDAMASDGHQTASVCHDIHKAGNVPVIDVRRGLHDLANLLEQRSAHSLDT